MIVFVFCSPYLFIYLFSFACHKVRFLVSAPFFICTLNVADVQTDCLWIATRHMCVLVCISALFNYIDLRLAFHLSRLKDTRT